MQHPSIFLKNRLDDLYSEAAKSQGSWEASKLLSVGGAIAAGLAAASNPLLLLFSSLSGVSYAWAVLKEGSVSGKFKPFPILTHSLGDLLSSMGGEHQEVEAVPAELKYLPPQQVSEALLLDFQAQAVARFLEEIDQGERDQAYKQLIRYFHFTFGDLVQSRPSLLFKSDEALEEAFAFSLTASDDLNSCDLDEGGEVPKTQVPKTQVPKMSIKQRELKNLAISLEKLPPLEEVDLAMSLFSPALGQDLKGILFQGESGAGKGNAIFGCSNELLRVYPGAELYAVNPKPAANEADRWEKYKSVLPVTDEESALEALEYVEAAETEMVKRQQEGRTGDPYVLVLDEFNTWLDLLGKDDRERLMKKVKRIIRQGRSNRVWLWIGAQTGNCEDFGISAPDRANFIRIALGFQGNMDALQIAIANPAMFPGLRGNVPAGLIQGLKNKGFGIAATSFFDRIIRIPNYLENPCPQQPPEKMKSPTIPENLLAPPPPPQPEIPAAEQEIAAHLKKIKIRKSSRQGIAIFKVWKWCTQQPPGNTVSLEEAWERFRKDRKGKLTRSEVEWSLGQLHLLELIEYAEAEENSD